MSRQMLIEQRCGSGSLQLTESVKESLKPGCLGTLKGPCADYKNKTRNGTFYSRKLWENVFNNDLVKEALEDRVLLGELDHPGDRLETKAANACIVMTGYEFDDNDQVVIGSFDILDTPSGRVLKSLLDYGCKIGVSSRGEGDVETSNGMDIVDEDTYYFVGYDAVALPSVKKAKPTLTESIQHKSLKESLRKEVETATTLSQLEMIKSVLKSTNLPDVDSLLESIDIKSKELIEGSTTSTTDNQVLLEDLESANHRIKELEMKNNDLNEDIITYKSRIKKIFESKLKASDKVKALERSKQNLEKDNSKLVFESAFSTKRIKSLEEELNRKDLRIEELTSEVRTTRSSNIKINNEVRSLSESLKKADQKSADSSKKLSEATRLVKSKDDEIHCLKESLESLKNKSAKIQENYADLLEGYIMLTAQVNNIDPKIIKESLKPEATFKDISSLVESIIDQKDRYSSLKITRDTLLNSCNTDKVRISSNQSRGSDKDHEAISFLEESMRKMI